MHLLSWTSQTKTKTGCTWRKFSPWTDWISSSSSCLTTFDGKMGEQGGKLAELCLHQSLALLQPLSKYNSHSGKFLTFFVQPKLNEKNLVYTKHMSFSGTYSMIFKLHNPCLGVINVCWCISTWHISGTQHIIILSPICLGHPDREIVKYFYLFFIKTSIICCCT